MHRMCQGPVLDSDLVTVGLTGSTTSTESVLKAFSAAVIICNVSDLSCCLGNYGNHRDASGGQNISTAYSRILSPGAGQTFFIRSHD